MIYQLLKLLIYLFFKTTICINCNLLPYCSFQLRYIPYQGKLLIHKLALFQLPAYIFPFVIDVHKKTIKEIYIKVNNTSSLSLSNLDYGNFSGRADFKNINPYILIKPFCKKLTNVKYWKDISISGNIQLNKNSLYIKNLKISNIPYIKTAVINGKILDNKIDLKIETLNHIALCNGTLENISLQSKSKLDLPYIKIKNYQINLKNGVLKWNTQFSNKFLGNCIYTGTWHKYLKSTLFLKKINHKIQINKNNNILSLFSGSLLKLKGLNINYKFITDIGDLNHIVKNTVGTILVKGDKIKFLQDLVCNLRILNGECQINNCQASISDFIHGIVYATGSINLNSLPHKKFSFPSLIKLQLPKCPIVNVPQIKGDISGTLYLKNLNEITGDVSLHDINLDLSPIINSALNSMNMTNSVFYKKNPIKQFTMPINTDINIYFPTNITAVGSGINSKWVGNCNIKSRKQEPINWNAQFNLINGTYKLANKSINITSGKCISNRDIPGFVELQLVGEKKINNDILGITFTQKNRRANIDFFSIPMKNRQDILSLLLFNKTAHELTAYETYSLNLMFQTLNISSDNIFKKLHDILKLDYIDFKKNNADTDAEYNSIKVGKKIGKNWQFNIEQSKDSTAIAIERQISNNAKANISASRTEGFGVGLTWSKRYN